MYQGRQEALLSDDRSEPVVDLAYIGRALQPLAGGVGLRLVNWRLIAAAFVLAGTALSPGFAGQSTVDLDLLPGLPPPADSGKPAIVPPQVAAQGQSEPESCLPPLPCGTRLLGTVRKNGAVELQVPALHW
jgi:hypothetical protein